VTTANLVVARLPAGTLHRRMDRGEPAPGRCRANSTRRETSVSTEQRENLDAILRQSAFPFDSDVNEQRRLLRELASAQPLPPR
jgi:hypothetical protein